MHVVYIYRLNTCESQTHLKTELQLQKNGAYDTLNDFKHLIKSLNSNIMILD